MEKIYGQISQKAKDVLEIANACKGNEEITLRLSHKLLKINEELLSFSKRIEGGMAEEIKVLGKKVHFFLENSKDKKLFSDINEISMRIIEEASSY